MIVKSDAYGNPVQAYNEYKQLFSSSDINLDTCINFAFLCWQMQEFGFNAYYHIDSSTIKKAYRTFPDVIAKAEDIGNGDSIEYFWDIYLELIDIGEDVNSKTLQHIIQRTEYIDAYICCKVAGLDVSEGIMHRIREATRRNHSNIDILHLL